jgi:hypothetical protein
MKSFIFCPLITSLFLTIQISYGQDFLDDLYISDNNASSTSSVDSNTEIINDTISE